MVPGRAGGGSFRGRRTCKPNKDFANRMHAGQPASAIPKPNFGALRRSVLWCFSGGLILFHGGDLMCCGVMWYDGMWLVSR